MDVPEIYAAQLLDPRSKYTNIPESKRDATTKFVQKLLKKQGTVVPDPIQPQKYSGVWDRISAKKSANVPSKLLLFLYMTG